MTGRAIPFILRRVRWFERHSRPRLAGLFARRWFRRVIGLVLIAFAVAAAIAPPFSGLDTLPAIGAVTVTLSIILEDIAVFVLGTAIGAGGIGLIVTVGAAAAHFVKGLVT